MQQQQQQQQMESCAAEFVFFFSVSKPECSKSSMIGTAHAQRMGLRTIIVAERHLSLQTK